MRRFLDILIDFISQNHIFTIVVLLVFLVIGIGARFLSNYLKHSSDVSIKLLEEYLKVRSFFTEELSELASLPFSFPVQNIAIDEHHKKLSKAFYQYWDYLPRELLVQLLCLLCCLPDPQNRLYTHKNGRITVVRPNDITDFVRLIAMTRNVRMYATLKLKNGTESEKRVAGIVCQARMVLLTFNNHFNLRDLRRFAKHIPKQEQVLFVPDEHHP